MAAIGAELLPKVFAGIAGGTDAIAVDVAFRLTAIFANSIRWSRVGNTRVISAARTEVVAV